MLKYATRKLDSQRFLPKEAIRLVLHAIDYGESILITGPRGCGKSALAQWAAAKRKRPIEIIHLGGNTDAESAMLGSMTLREGETRFVRSRFAEAVSTPNTVIVLDEFNRVADPKFHGLLLALMDGHGRLSIDLEEPGRRIVERAEGVSFIATANLGAEYQGTEPLDAALLDRMIKLRLSYSAREEELIVAEGIARPQARSIMRWVREIRRLEAQGVLTSSISTRGICQVVGLLHDGFDMQSAFEAVVGAWDEESLTALRATLKVES